MDKGSSPSIPSFTELLHRMLRMADNIESTSPLTTKLIRSAIANYGAEMRRINGA
jgi:hypothetical protein